FFAIIYSTNQIELRDYFTIEIACYLIGLNTPHFFKSIRQSLATKLPLDELNEEPNSERWHQYEKPILTLNQDRLNRGELVNRLFNVITSNENADTRGIAIIGPFGIGKSSVINMTLSEIQMAFHSYIPCRINSWGTYSSEEQIQKHIIEQVINSLGKVTSTTSLSGLPSKYIHTLKGAQSLWLDILPIFDNHSSPSSQLAEIDNLLVNLKIKIIIIIEDLDRNKDAETMLNSIAPLIDTLNKNSSFRFILSIGQK
ncbi:TPA: P-loop NTPase fold protein, partial [Aeromonas hydrophila]